MSYYFTKTLHQSFEAALDRVVEVAAIDPISSMQAVENPGLGEVAQEIQGKLKRVIENL